jgi:dynein heavy chain
MWKLTLWADIDTDMMEDGTKAFVKAIREFPKFMKVSKAHIGIDGLVKNFLIVVPLIADLHHPSMRPRHWEALKVATKKDFELNDKFSMKDLIDLELFKFEDDVGEIVNRAQKEEKMETALAKISEVWSQLEFSLSAHRGSPCPAERLFAPSDLHAYLLVCQAPISRSAEFRRRTTRSWRTTRSRCKT